MVHFPKKQFQVNGINVIEKSLTITIGSFQIPLPTVKKKYEMLIVGDIHIPIEVMINHKYRGSIVAFSINKSVEPYEELNVGFIFPSSSIDHQYNSTHT